MPIFGVLCLKLHGDANDTNEKRLSVSTSSSIQGPGRKYYTSSLNATIRYQLKRNELYQICKQGVSFPHIRHFCTSFSSADLSSSCWVIPTLIQRRVVAEIIIGRCGTKRKFSRSSESFCTTRLKKTQVHNC